MTASFLRSNAFFALTTLASALAALVCLPAPAAAQVAIVVNGSPITTFDIEQRSKFNQLTARKPSVRQEIIDELIEEKLKISAAKRYGLEASQTEIDTALTNIASRMRATPQQLAQQLASQGINMSTFRSRLQADIVWQQLVRGKYQASLQIRERDILTALDTRKDEKDKVGVEYTLRPVLFVVAKGAPQPVIDAKKREAEGLRGRFQSCEDGLPFAQGIPEVVVRDQIVRNSADLTPALRTMLDNITVGRLSTPEVTQNGIEMFALCGKKETTTDTAAKREIRDEMFAERFSEQAQRYLKELRRAAMIEFK
jgi:peptidyl-prolyl cis-trans isomerase SurA